MNTAIRFFAEQLRRASAPRDPNEIFAERLTFGERLADRVAAVGGSWSFIIGFGLFLTAWAALNTVILAANAFDPFPFIFLNLMLSMLAGWDRKPRSIIQGTPAQQTPSAPLGQGGGVLDTLRQNEQQPPAPAPGPQVPRSQ